MLAAIQSRSLVVAIPVILLALFVVQPRKFDPPQPTWNSSAFYDFPREAHPSDHTGYTSLIQDMRAYGDKWLMGDQLLFEASYPTTYRLFIPTPQPGSYQLKLGYTSAPDYMPVSIFAQDKAWSLDTVSPEVQHQVLEGTIIIQQGEAAIIQFYFDPQPNKRLFGLDYLHLQLID
jgi:hypothetical protein